MLKNMKIIKEIQEKLVLGAVHMKSDKVSWKSKVSCILSKNTEDRYRITFGLSLYAMSLLSCIGCIFQKRTWGT